MQTISLPYQCDSADVGFLADVRRVFSAAVRTAYVSAVDGGMSLKQKELRDLVKRRFAGGFVDAWVLHCATLEGMDLRKARPDGRMVFGTRAGLERRQKGLIERNEWREMRLRPLCSRGDKTYAGNRHFRLSADARTCTFQMYGRKALLRFPQMNGNAGEVLQQAAKLAGEKKINLTFRMDSRKLHITIDPEDLPHHPQRRPAVIAKRGRCLGIDLNPNWIGIAAVENIRDPRSVAETSLLEHALVKLDMAVDASPETVCETLAAVCDRAISMARKHRCGTIVLERGLGKLRSSGRSRSLNRILNYWARTVFVAMLTRRARLAGIEVLEVWAGYSSTIGNLAFEAPDACASATEIARRGIARLAGMKVVLPALEEGCVSRLWKNGKVPVELGSWQEVHRTIKAAKIGYRRPHPDVPIGARGSDVHGTEMFCGHAVVRLGRCHRPGIVFRPIVASVRPDAAVGASERYRGRTAQASRSTPKSQ